MATLVKLRNPVGEKWQVKKKNIFGNTIKDTSNQYVEMLKHASWKNHIIFVWGEEVISIT